MNKDATKQLKWPHPSTSPARIWLPTTLAHNITHKQYTPNYMPPPSQRPGQLAYIPLDEKDYKDELNTIKYCLLYTSRCV